MNLFILVLGSVVLSIAAEKEISVVRFQEKRQLNQKQGDRQAPISLSPTAIKYLTETQKSQQNSDYNGQDENYNPQTLNYAPQEGGLPPHVVFGFSPQPQPQQQIEYVSQPISYPHQKGQGQIQYVSQPIAYQEPKGAAGPSLQKLAPNHFSPASEVSSFRFSSPLVTYSNHGVLSQVTGKALAAAQNQAAPAKAAPEQKSAQATNAQPASQQYEYADSPEIDYAPQQVTYQQIPQQYSNYANVPQQLKYPSLSQRLVYAQAEGLPQNAKILYAQGPQQFSGSQSAPQQAAPQQNAPSQQQFTYSFVSPQAAQSNFRPIYATPNKYSRPQYHLQ